MARVKDNGGLLDGERGGGGGETGREKAAGGGGSARRTCVAWAQVLTLSLLFLL
jgi:hypothetical protein